MKPSKSENKPQNKNNTFLAKIITSGSGWSSKRLMGILCILFAMVFAMFGLFLGESGVVDGTISAVLIEFLTAGVALFGVTMLEKKNYSKNNEEY